MKFIPFTIRDREIRMSGWKPGAGDGQHVEDEMVKYLDQNQKTIPQLSSTQLDHTQCEWQFQVGVARQWTVKRAFGCGMFGRGTRACVAEAGCLCSRRGVGQ